jgi:hypothetical protein
MDSFENGMKTAMSGHSEKASQLEVGLWVSVVCVREAGPWTPAVLVCWSCDKKIPRVGGGLFAHNSGG